MRKLLISLAGLALLVACGPGEVGDQCYGAAAENDCVDGALCTLARSEEVAPPTDPNNERYYCRSVCELPSDCEAGFECRRAAGTMFNTCQPDDDALPPEEGEE